MRAVKALAKAVFPLYNANDTAGLEQILAEATRYELEGGRRVRAKAKAVRQEAGAYLTRLQIESTRAAQRPEAAETAAEDIVPANVSPVSLGLALAGALVMLIAIFLPRVESPRSFARIADNTLIQTGGGWWFVGLAVAIGTAAWYAYRSNSRAAGTLVLGVIAIGVAVYYGKSHGSLTLCPIGATEETAACETASPGVGIYAAGVGGLLAAIGGLGIWRAPAADETVDAVDDAEPSSPGEAENDLAQRLRTLDNLRAQGLLTEVEYEQRRMLLLDQI
jgi:hypothetical protein